MNAPVVNTGEEHLVHCKNCGARTPFNRSLRCPECNIRLWGHRDESGIFQKREGGKGIAWLVELPLFGVHELNKGEICIGRSSGGIEPDIDCSRDPTVSRRQAIIHTRYQKNDLRIFITDGDGKGKSRNGTLVREELIKPSKKVEIFDGDTFQVGHTRFMVMVRYGGKK